MTAPPSRASAAPAGGASAPATSSWCAGHHVARQRPRARGGRPRSGQGACRDRRRGRGHPYRRRRGPVGRTTWVTCSGCSRASWCTQRGRGARGRRRRGRLHQRRPAALHGGPQRPARPRATRVLLYRGRFRGRGHARGWADRRLAPRGRGRQAHAGAGWRAPARSAVRRFGRILRRLRQRARGLGGGRRSSGTGAPRTWPRPDELIGAESYVLENVRDTATARAFLEKIENFKRYAANHGATAEGNPTGGNNFRGLYNIALKSLGAARKKGAGGPARPRHRLRRTHARAGLLLHGQPRQRPGEHRGARWRRAPTSSSSSPGTARSPTSPSCRRSSS